MTPVEARNYIAVFRKHTIPGTDYVNTSSGRRIQLNDMSDEDAVFIAGEFQRMEIEAADRKSKRDSN